MNQEESNYWGKITTGGSRRWREDTIARLSGWGAPYYISGESGAFIRVSPEGMLQMGIYEEAMPHIGETISTVKARKDCDSFNAAFQYVCQLGGRTSLTDIFSSDRIPLNMQQSAQLTTVQEGKSSLDTEEAELKDDFAISMWKRGNETALGGRWDCL